MLFRYACSNQPRDENGTTMLIDLDEHELL